MIPKLQIKYSFIYDKMLHQYHEKRFLEDSTWKEGDVYARKLQRRWDKINNQVFSKIQKYSGLKWQESIIKAYVVKYVSAPFSQPLTLKIWPDFKEQEEIIIHELIHNLFVQNKDDKLVKINKLEKDYPKGSFQFYIHIVLHAILKKVLIDIYGEKQTKILISKYYHKGFPKIYGKAWDIVEKEGADTIIKKYIKKGKKK